jgi:hypothetical protein
MATVKKIMAIAKTSSSAIGSEETISLFQHPQEVETSLDAYVLVMGD